MLFLPTAYDRALKLKRIADVLAEIRWRTGLIWPAEIAERLYREAEILLGIRPGRLHSTLRDWNLRSKLV